MIVTPCVGVWIEISSCFAAPIADLVTPCVGVWIEIYGVFSRHSRLPVTPCVGVWIEIHFNYNTKQIKMSHSLRGSVD